MSRSVTHFAAGGTFTAILVALLPNVSYPRTLVLVGGAWAMIPDASKLFEHPALREFHDSPVADIFWFHRVFDSYDSTDSVRVGAVSVALFIGITAILEGRSYRPPDVVEEYLETESDRHR